jgi:hypothetical protein
MVFGASSDITGLPFSVGEVGLSGLMQRALVAFANDPEHGLEVEMEWPRFDEEGKTIVLLGVENGVEPRMGFPHSYELMMRRATTRRTISGRRSEYSKMLRRVRVVSIRSKLRAAMMFVILYRDMTKNNHNTTANIPHL